MATTLIVKANQLENAKNIFKTTDLKITSEEERHLGAEVASSRFKNEFVDSKVKSWVSDVKDLAKNAEEEPQLAFAAFTKGLCKSARGGLMSKEQSQKHPKTSSH